MELIELTKKNVSEYSDFIEQDMAENLERRFYRGLAAKDDDGTKAAMIWELANIENESDNECVIRFFKGQDAQSAGAMLDAYTKRVRNQGVKKSSVVISTENGKAEKDILKAAGFSMKITESDNIIVSLSELLSMPVMKSRKVQEGVVSLREVTVRQFKKGISKCVSLGKKGLCEDIEYLPKVFFEENVSCCFKRDGDINSFLLFHKLPSGLISIQMMLCMDKEISTVLVGMMRQFVTNLEKEYGADTKVLLNRHNQASLMLSEKLLPRGFGIPVYSGSRLESES